MNDKNYLVHHGILGQKWGVRRYQNYDGTLTQRGLARYRKSKERYNSAKEEYKSAKKFKDSSSIQDARDELRISRNRYKADKKQLWVDNARDKGKRLLDEGYTISGKKRNTALARASAFVASFSATYLYSLGGPAAMLAIGLGGSLVSSILGHMNNIDATNMEIYSLYEDIKSMSPAQASAKIHEFTKKHPELRNLIPS